MSILWRCLIAAGGLFVLVSGTTKSQFAINRILVAAFGIPYAVGVIA